MKINKQTPFKVLADGTCQFFVGGMWQPPVTYPTFLSTPNFLKDEEWEYDTDTGQLTVHQGEGVYSPPVSPTAPDAGGSGGGGGGGNSGGGGGGLPFVAEVATPLVMVEDTAGQTTIVVEGSNALKTYMDFDNLPTVHTEMGPMQFRASGFGGESRLQSGALSFLGVGGTPGGGVVEGLDTPSTTDTDHAANVQFVLDQVNANTSDGKLNVTNHTSNVTLTPQDSGSLVTNAGASGDIQVTLPAAEVGLVYEFAVLAGNQLSVAAASGNNLRAGGTTGSTIDTSVMGSTMRLVAVSSSEWLVVSSQHGPWNLV